MYVKIGRNNNDIKNSKTSPGETSTLTTSKFRCIKLRRDHDLSSDVFPKSVLNLFFKFNVWSLASSLRSFKNGEQHGNLNFEQVKQKWKWNNELTQAPPCLSATFPVQNRRSSWGLAIPRKKLELSPNLSVQQFWWFMFQVPKHIPSKLEKSRKYNLTFRLLSI